MARGDLIYVLRDFLNREGVYKHYGIDCGDGSVIHYRKPSETIERTSLEIFARGNPVYIKSYPTAFIGDVVVRRAESRLGEQKYNLLFNNCEHFALWSKTGMSYSQQVRDFIPAISRMKIEDLYDSIDRALDDTDRANAHQLLNNALAEIKTVWDDIQPKYKQAIAEVQSWDRVAKEAVRRDREDLAREAIRRKLEYKTQAKNLETQLDKLAKMTETLLKNSLHLNQT